MVWVVSEMIHGANGSYQQEGQLWGRGGVVESVKSTNSPWAAAVANWGSEG